jgi:hypothetical protein
MTCAFIGRVAGIALLSLGLGCWMGRQEEYGGWALFAMLTYNLLVTIYLVFVGLSTEFVGVLLWPLPHHLPRGATVCERRTSLCGPTLNRTFSALGLFEQACAF